MACALVTTPAQASPGRPAPDFHAPDGHGPDRHASNVNAFDIPAGDRAQALIAFAVQAGVSLGGASACPGRSESVRGAFSNREALKRLLNGAPCRFEFVDAVTIRIVRDRLAAAPPGAPAHARRPEIAAAAEPVAASLQEVVVTATKRPARPGEIAASVSVLRGDELSLTDARDATGTVSQIAGLIMTNLGPGRDKILLRGLSDGAFTGRTQSTVATYLEDVPLNYNAPDPDLKLADVARIEVVRGPQGALYGAGSLSGIYRIVPNPPDPSGASARITAAGSWTHAGAPGREIEAVVNAPLGDRLTFRSVAYAEFQGGYLDDAVLRLSNVDGARREGGRAAIAAQLSGDWTATLSGTTQHLMSADTQYVTTRAAPRRRANRVREDHEDDFAEAALTIAGSGSWGRVQSTSAYVHHAFTSRYDASAALSLYGESERDIGIYDEEEEIGRLVQDLVWTSRADAPLRSLAGLYISATREDTPSDLLVATALLPPRAVYRERRKDQITEEAAYGEIQWDFAPAWTLSAGGRVFSTHLATRSRVMAAGAVRSLDRGRPFDGVSPKLSIQYAVPGGGTAYLLFSGGFRAGGVNTGGISPPSPGRRAFASDRLENYEAGLKLRLFDDRLDLRAAAFVERWQNLQTDQYLASGLSYTANAGNARVLGAEAEAALTPAAGWTVTANALIDSAELTRPSPAFVARLHASLPGTPPASGGLIVAHEHRLSDAASLVLTAEAAYVGKSRLTFDPMVSPAMGNYVTGSVSAQLVTRRWRLAAYLHNPSNESKNTFAYGNPFSFGQVRQVTPLRPRTVTLLLERRF